jgi:hypothetical protein
VWALSQAMTVTALFQQITAKSDLVWLYRYWVLEANIMKNVIYI